MANRARDLNNQTFGWLTVLKRVGSHKRDGALWLVRCRCGKELTKSSSQLLHKPRRPNQAEKSCGCNRQGHRVYTSKYGSAGYLSGHHFGRLQAQARHRGHRFEVTTEYLWECFVEQEGRCALTGVPLALSRKTALPGETIASLDRIESDKGYAPGNVQWVHPTVNFMKHAMRQDLFIEWCRCVAAYKR